MLKNPKFYKVLGILLFVSSAIISVMYTVSGVIGFIPTLIALIQGSVIEAVKSGFTYIAVAVNGIGWKIFFGTLALIAFCLSVIFTMGFNINMTNKVKNVTLYNSDKYAQQQKATQTQQDLYEQTKKNVDDKKVQRDSQINGMAKTRDAWGNNYKTAKSLEQDKINNTTAKYNSEIAMEQEKLNKLAESLQNVTSEEVTEDGYMSMYELFSKKLNDFTSSKKAEKKPWTPEDIEFWLTTAISLFIEFAGIGCIIRSEYLAGSVETSLPVKKDMSSSSNIGFKPTLVTAKGIDTTTNLTDADYLDIPVKKMQTIGFYSAGSTASTGADKNIDGFLDVVESPKPCTTHSVHEIDNKILSRYLEYIYSNVKTDQSIPGYQTTAKDLNLGLDFVRKLKNHCEHLNILESDAAARKTFILKPRNEIKLLNL